MRTSFHIIGVFFVAAACGLFLSSSAAPPASPTSSFSITQKADTDIQEVAGSPPKQETAGQSQKEETDESEKTGHSIPITMYMQNDPAWADFLYGGQDPMSGYGCGPTALAIAAASLTHEPITPVDTAVWSASNGYFSPQNGTVHGLIPNGAKYYGLQVEVLNNLTPDNFCLALSTGKVMILLMGPGDFSDSGHFIVAYGYDSNGDILVADPASNERSSVHWPADTLISQLLMTAKSGGPVWVLSKS